MIVDSNVLIAICCKEAGRHALADAELVSYASRGYQFFAPGCIVSECLYVLAEKVDRHKTLTPAEHAARWLISARTWGCSCLLRAEIFR